MAKDFEEPTAEEISVFQTLSPEQQASLAAINPEGAAAASYKPPESIYYYDLDGNFVNGPRPENANYDPSIEAFRESSTSVIPDSRYTENAWGLGSPTFDPETGSYGDTPGIVWNGPGPAPIDGYGSDAMFEGGPYEGMDMTLRDDGSVTGDIQTGVDPAGGWVAERGPDGTELSLGPGSGLNDIPRDKFPNNLDDYLTGSDGATYGASPKDAYFGRDLELGGGGINVGGVGDQSLLDALRPDKTGYESSSNKDFYQKQFQDMRTQEAGNDMRQWAAAIRAGEAANAPAPENKDPWSWANLPQVQTGGSVAATPIEWGYNPSYGVERGMTNQQATSAMSSVLNTNEAALLNALWQDNPNAASSTSWTSAGNPQAANLAISQGGTPRSPELTDAVNKVISNIYTQTGGGTGGISVPTGYANPTNS